VFCNTDPFLSSLYLLGICLLFISQFKASILLIAILIFYICMAIVGCDTKASVRFCYANMAFVHYFSNLLAKLLGLDKGLTDSNNNHIIKSWKSRSYKAKSIIIARTKNSTSRFISQIKILKSSRVFLIMSNFAHKFLLSL